MFTRKPIPLQNMKRFTLWTVAAMALIAGLCACGSANEDPSAPDLGVNAQRLENVGCQFNPLAPTGAWASSIENASFPATNAVDANPTTRWSSAFSDPQWIVVDLGATRHIRQFNVTFETAASRVYDIQVSTDANTWTTVFHESQGTSGQSAFGRIDHVGRYVRLYSYQRTTPYGVSIYEFSLYGDQNASCANDPLASTFRIEAVHSGKAVEVEGFSTQNGANVQQWQFVGGTNQQWVLTSNPDATYRIRNLLSGKCLDIGGTGNGARAQQWDCHGGDNQRFYVEQKEPGTFTIRAKHSGRCLDVINAGLANGVKLQQWDCHGLANQSFIFTATQAPPGTYVWARPGSGAVDAANNLYGISLTGELSRLDPQTGRTLWALTRQESIYVRPECTTSDGIVGVQNNRSPQRVVKINAQTGAIAWAQDFGGVITGPNAGAFVTCRLGVDFVLVQYGTAPAVQIAAVRTSDGAVLSNRTFANGANIVYMANDVVVTQETTAANEQIWTGYNPQGGAVLWTKTTTGTNPAAYNISELYVYFQPSPYQASVQRWEPTTGQVLWTYTANAPNLAVFVRPEDVYVASSSAITRIDRASGAARWTLAVPSNYGSFPTFIDQNLFSLTIAATGPSSPAGPLTVYSSATGEAIRTFQPIGGGTRIAYLVRDGEQYLASGRTLSRVDPSTGALLWTATIPLSNPSVQFGNIVDATPTTLYLDIGQFVRFGRSGFIAVDRQTGAIRWTYWKESFAYFITATPTSLIIAPGEGIEAIAK